MSGHPGYPSTCVCGHGPGAHGEQGNVVGVCHAPGCRCVGYSRDPFPLVGEADLAELPTVGEWLSAGAPMRLVTAADRQLAEYPPGFSVAADGTLQINVREVLASYGSPDPTQDEIDQATRWLAEAAMERLPEGAEVVVEE